MSDRDAEAATQMAAHGQVQPGFEPVRDVFLAALREGQELGAGFCAMVDGEPVVDLWGGSTDAAGTRPWKKDTLVPVFSTTKGIAALVVAGVIDRSAGAISYETPVSQIWPEFGVAGKDRLTIADVLSHQAGLPGFVEAIDPDLWLDPPALADALAGQAPMWPPGTAHGYHPLSWGYIAGELVRRIDGRSLGTVLAEDICAPHGIDFAIGLPDVDHARVADIQRPKALPDMGPLNAFNRAAFLTRWAAPKRGGKVWRSIEIPSANGHGTARAIAALYGIFARQGRLGSEVIIGPGTFADLIASRTEGADLVLPFVTEFAAGVMRNNAGFYGPNPNTLAHSGWGGSMALGDPDLGLSAAYIMNRQSNHLQGDPRARRLVEALYSCI